ncbi:MAG: hypothetical protein LBS70_10300 [Candidatus Accumulibacter sp.]|jgi:hypothetical protein|nr:hypothetical protein [Accumulibacter sp.]
MKPSPAMPPAKRPFNPALDEATVGQERETSAREDKLRLYDEISEARNDFEAALGAFPDAHSAL